LQNFDTGFELTDFIVQGILLKLLSCVDVQFANSDVFLELGAQIFVFLFEIIDDPLLALTFTLCNFELHLDSFEVLSF